MFLPLVKTKVVSNKQIKGLRRRYIGYTKFLYMLLD